jgi:hypothetical protein
MNQKNILLMYANPIFPQVVADYRTLLSEGVTLSLSHYCRQRRVGYASLAQWMRRHGIHVSSLRMEAILEKYKFTCEGKESLVLSEEQVTALLHPLKKEKQEALISGIADALKGVTLGFPDGVTISIRMVSPAALVSFLTSYTCQSQSICLP